MNDITTGSPEPADDGQVHDTLVEDSAEQERKGPWVVTEPTDVVDEGKSNPLGLLVIAGLFAMLWFWAGPRYFFVVVGLIVMIFLHELGHYMTARWTGMKVTQFFLFMGPRVWSFKRGETEYGIRLLPIGAFVRIVGMHNLDPHSAEDAPRAYMNKSYPRRMFVITAGSMMHFIQALILFIVITSVVGQQDHDNWTVGEISRLETGETPAVEAGLQPGDALVAIDGIDSSNWGETVRYLQDRPGEEVALTVLRNGQTLEMTTVLAERENEDGEIDGFLGVGAAFERKRTGPIDGVEMFGQMTWGALQLTPRFLSPSTFSDLGQLLFKGSDTVEFGEDESERPISVVGAVRIAGQPDFDITWPLLNLAGINVFVGILNLLPLLPLDGGHAAIATYERLRSNKEKKHHVDISKLLAATYVVVFILGFLMLSTVYLDLVRPISS